jgi:hypothetical protein
MVCGIVWIHTRHADKLSTLLFDALLQRICCVWMDGAAIDNHLAPDVFFQNGVDSRFYGGIVSKAHEDHVGLPDGISNGLDHFGLVGAEFGG